jgi:hypothetical protein
VVFNKTLIITGYPRRTIKQSLFQYKQRTN